MMDTVLFTDHGIVVFAISASAIALLLSVLGLAATHQMRADIKHHSSGLPHGERRVQQGRPGVCLLTGFHYARALRPRYFPHLHSEPIHRRHRPDRLEDRRHSAPGRPRGHRRLAPKRYQQHHRRGPQGGHGRRAGGDRPRQFAII
jgi:hypothetical protein